MNVLPGSKVSSCDEQIKLRALLDRVSLKKKKKKKKKKNTQKSWQPTTAKENISWDL